MRRILALVLATLVVTSWPSRVLAQTPQTPQTPGTSRTLQTPQTPAPPVEDHSHHQPPAPDAAPPPVAAPLPDFIPPVTDADRAAAFPDVMGHSVHDNAVNYFVLFDQLEWQTGAGASGLGWDTRGWVGNDRTRAWFRAEGERSDGRARDAQFHAFAGRRLFRWWDVVAGVRQDLRPGPAQTYAAIGVQGLAPQWFEVEATAYLGAAGRTHLRIESQYELLITNRLVLQPLVELEIYGKADPVRRIGAGLSTVDAGVRLRYEFRREWAPYVGVAWQRSFFGTATRAAAAGEETRGARLVVGLRVWR
jgi:copper resistance protein B